jgi:hypothetical protein
VGENLYDEDPLSQLEVAVLSEDLERYDQGKGSEVQ